MRMFLSLVGFVVWKVRGHFGGRLEVYFDTRDLIRGSWSTGKAAWGAGLGGGLFCMVLFDWERSTSKPKNLN